MMRERALEIAQVDTVEAPVADAEIADTTSHEDSTVETAIEDAHAPVLFREDGEGIEVVVATDRMRVLLSSAGGEIRSVKLLDYSRNEEESVELVPEGAKGGMALSVERGGEWRDLSDVVFDVSVDGLPAGNGRQVTVTGQEQVEVAFEVEGAGGGRIEKRYTFTGDGYEVGMNVKMRRDGELQGTGAYSVAWKCGMGLNEVDEKAEKRLLAALGKVGEELYKESVGKFGDSREKSFEGGMVIWACARSRYFLSAIIPEVNRPGSVKLIGSKQESLIGYSIGYPFRGDPRLVEDSFSCYLGPLDIHRLKGYGNGLEKAIELGWLRFFSIWILRLMKMMKSFIPNYGLIIIILSVLTKVLFYRLTHKSFKSMKDMQRIQPKMKELQEKYKNDRERLNKETMKLYKEAGVNPLGGCLPLLFQMPVFIALFGVLRNTIELRHAPFMLWINDLSSPDVLFGFGVKLPFLGSNFHLLPVLMGGAMVLQSKLGGSPTGQTGPAAQTKMMSTMMPIVFTVIFYSMPSGLVLYWLVNNVLTIIQQYYAHKQIEAEEREGEGGGADPMERDKNRSVDDGADIKADKVRGRSRKKGKAQSKKSKRRPYN